ncbi:MAG: hypothetical protein V1663_02565 [archaeon]
MQTISKKLHLTWSSYGDPGFQHEEFKIDDYNGIEKRFTELKNNEHVTEIKVIRGEKLSLESKEIVTKFVIKTNYHGDFIE